MLQHPWTELQVLIKEKWLTQKAFASILWKKVSEVNELLKWKRNITIQRDYLLHQTLWTPIKYWILKQIDYDYSLIDIDETQHQDVILSDSKESSINTVISNDDEKSTNQTKKPKKMDSSADESASEWQSKPQKTQVESQEIPIQEQEKEIDEDHQKRVRIFRSF